MKDAYGNVATASSASVTLAVTGPNGYNQSYGPKSAVNGIVSFDLSAAALAVGSYTYTASSANLIFATASEGVTPTGTQSGYQHFSCGLERLNSARTERHFDCDGKRRGVAHRNGWFL